MDGNTRFSRDSWSAGITPKVAVVGIGGAGCNIVSDIYQTGDDSVTTIAINMDRRGLDECCAHRKLSICQRVTRGEGAKGDPDLGRSCGKAHREEIEDALRGFDVVFLIAGLGGGTGSGACPVVADICRRMDQILFAVLVTPFSFEGPRVGVAREALRRMNRTGCITAVVDNDVLLKSMPDVSMEEALRAANHSVHAYVRGKVDATMRVFEDQLSDIGSLVEETRASGPSGLLTVEAVRI